MLKTRWKKVFADIWGNKSRSILVILSISIGVFAIGVVASAYLILDAATNDGYQVVNPTSAFLMADAIDEDLVDSIRDLPEVSEAEGRKVINIRANLEGHWYSTDLSALDYDNMRVNKLEPTEGETKPGDRQLLLDQSALALTTFRIGDIVVLEMADGSLFELPIVGTVRDQNANPSLNSGGINVYTTLDTFEWLGESTSYNRLLFIAAENKHDPDHIKSLTGEIKDVMERGGSYVYYTLVFAEPGVSPVKFIIETIRSVLGILALVSLVLSAFLVYNTMSALILRQVKYIGVMKAIGADTGDMIRLYLLLVILLGFMAFLVAIIPAAVGAHRFAGYIASPALLDLALPNFRIAPTVLALELFVSMLIPILAALPAIRGGTRVTVHAALNSQGLSESEFSGSILEKVIDRVKFITGPGLLALGNILRDQRRVSLTLITLTLGGAVFIGVLSVSASSDHTVAEMGEAYRYDIQVDFDYPYRISEIERYALEVPGISQVEGWATVSGTIINSLGEEGNSMTILGPPAESNLTRPKIVAGRWLQPGDRNALVIDTSLLREDPTLKVGGEILLKIAGQEENWKIVGVYQSLGARVWYESYANFDYISRLAKEIGKARHFKLVATAHDPLSQGLIAAKIEEAFRKHGLRVSGIETSASLRNILVEQFDIIVSVLIIMALLISLVGGLGLAGTMSMNVIERTREIGVLRALGASDRTVLRIVLAEGLILALISWFLSLFLALPVGKLMSLVVGTEIANGPLSYVYSFTGAIIWFGLVVFIAIVASFFPARNASRLTVHDVLAYE